MKMRVHTMCVLDEINTTNFSSIHNNSSLQVCLA